MCGWVAWRRVAWKGREEAGFAVSFPEMVRSNKKLTEQISHRGSKSPTFKSTPAWLLGHVRLPIQGDQSQPMRGNGIDLVYNGEIFNYDTQNYDSDANWLFNNLDRPKTLETLDGFYSFAYTKHKLLFIGTDYLAQKPVYIRYDDGLVIGAASEMRGLLLHEELENWQNLVDPFWLSTVRKFRYYPFNDDRTWHKDIKTLPPGTMACIDEEGGESWQRPFGPIVPRKGIAQLDPVIMLNKICAARELRHLLIEAIRTRIDLSDVPVSILLSGGLDSSIIYTVANNILGKNVTTFTIDNAEDQKYVSLLNPKNLRFLDFDDTPLETILRANEGPVDLGSMTAQYLIGQAIRKEGFDVALSGDGADELFGGYRRINKYDSQQSDVWSELVNYHLPRLDKMMMQHTVELRSPYLARPVVEFALALPYQWRINKNLLKMAFEDYLPEEIINRPKEPLKIEGVRNNKEDHTLKMVDEWLSLERPI